MCGVCGFVGPGDRGLLKDMTRVLAHRGPDNEGLFIGEGVGLGHRRLSVIDLSPGANQPMCNEEGDIWISYSGEIYNFMELRGELEANGHSFKSRSDTEVIVHAYEEYGDKCVELFNGMFAFALWDSGERRLLLARDRFGIKPMHYYMGDGVMLFASEIKSILQYPGLEAEVDLQSMHYYINLRYVPGVNTMFKGVRRLLPGHTLTYQGGRVSLSSYWEPSITESRHPESYFVKKTRRLLEESVKRHLISDIPLGVCLSGGIDSSTVVALATKYSDDPVDTFCMGFGNPQDEVEDARIVAQAFDTNHHELVVQDHLIRDYPEMIWYADEPKRNLYPFYVYELAAEQVKSVLGGLGGDEVFGGYVFKYKYVAKIDRIRGRVNKALMEGVEKAAKEILALQTRHGDIVDDDELDYLDMMRYLDSNVDLYLVAQTLDRVFNPEYLKKIYGLKLSHERLRDVRQEYMRFFDSGGDFINQVFTADFAVKMVDDFLLVDDRMSCANSVESRVPFLENNLVAFSFTIPASQKLSDPNGKNILRKAVRDLLPKNVLSKEKRGFASSTLDTYVRELRECAAQSLPEGNLVTNDLIKKDYVLKVLNEIPNPRLRLHYDVIWNLYAAEIWYEIYINGNPRKPKIKANKVM
jgi:asparagine synthase (glutamine-hydrolysing)